MEGMLMLWGKGMRKLVVATALLLAVSVPAPAQPAAAGATATTPMLTHDAAELEAQQFILDGSGLSDWALPDRIQIWNIAVARLRKFGLGVEALPAIHAAYAADSRRYTELALKESAWSVDLFTALAGNDTKTAATVQLELDKIHKVQSRVLQHIRLDTYLSEAAGRGNHQ